MPPWSWRRSPTASRPARSTSPWSIPAWAPIARSSLPGSDGRATSAPDNGLLSRLARRIPPTKLVRLSQPEYWLHPVSATFHGRDILAPVAARLSLGLDPDHLGDAHPSLVMLDWLEVRVGPGCIEGSVLAVDSFGNVITDITAELLACVPAAAAARIHCRGHEVTSIAHTYGQHVPGALIALLGSSNHLELAIVGGSAARALDARPGDDVVVRWNPIPPLR